MTFKQYHAQIKQDERYQKLDFSVDGREHYVYRITDYTRTEKQHYYGSHTPRKGKKYNNLIDEFWTYRTSSKKNVLNENKRENYKIKILKVFNNPADKMIYESYLHQYFDVKRSKHFWNGSNQTPFNFDTTGQTSGKGTIAVLGLGRIPIEEYDCKKHKTSNKDKYKTSVSCISCRKLFNKKSTHFKYCKNSNTKEIKPNNGNFIKVLDVLTFTSSVQDKRYMTDNYVSYCNKIVVIKRGSDIIDIMTNKEFNVNKLIPYNSLKKTSKHKPLIKPIHKNQHYNKIARYENCYIEKYTLKKLSNSMLQYLKDKYNEYNTYKWY